MIVDNDVSAKNLQTFGRAFAICTSQENADAWCQAARRIARDMRRPYRTWGYSLSAVWYVNAVIEDWPSTTAERRALQEWEKRAHDAPVPGPAPAVKPPGGARQSSPQF